MIKDTDDVGMAASNSFRQRLKESEKNDDWCIETIDFIRSHGRATDELDMDKLYRVYNGYMEHADYSYFTNPYGSASESTKDLGFPARIKDYPIIKPVIDLLVGEKSKRFTGWQVIVTNSDSIELYREELNKVLRRNLEQRAINTLNQLGYNTGVDSDPNVPKPQELYQQFTANYKDTRAIIGQEALEYILMYHRIFDQFLRGFLDFCVSGRVVSFRNVQHGDLQYEIFSPLQLTYEKGANDTFIEDSNWTKRIYEMTNSGVIDEFGDYLSEDEVKQLEEPEDANSGMLGSGGSMVSYIQGGYGVSDMSDTASHQGHRTKQCVIEHCVWRAFRQVGERKYIDEFGQEQSELVDKDLYEGKDITEWFWISDIWNGYCINNSIYIKMGRWEHQIHSLTRARRTPLPYNGRDYSDRHSPAQSMCNIGIPHQALHNLLHYKFELVMAKNRDKIILMDYHAIPKIKGWDEFKFMWMVDAFGFMFIDTTGKANPNFNQYTVLDASLGEYAKQMLDIMAMVKDEYEESIGVTRQRKGQMNSSDSVGGSQMALGQSAIINEELFKKYEEFEERELQHLLDLSQYAWRDGKKAVFVSSDRRNVMLDLDPKVYSNIDMGLFTKNNAKENEKLKQMKSLVDRIAQNPETKNRDLAEIIDADNYPQLKEYLDKADAAAAALAERQNVIQEQQTEAMLTNGREARDFESTENQLDRQNKLDVVSLQVGVTLATSDDGSNTQALERLRMIVDENLQNQKLNIEREKNQVAREKIQADIKKEEIKLRNPVAGETKTKK